MEDKNTRRETFTEGEYIITVDRETESGELEIADVTRVLDDGKREVCLWSNGEFSISVWNSNKRRNGKIVRIFPKGNVQIENVINGGTKKGGVTQLKKENLDHKEVMVKFLEDQGVPDAKDRWNDLQEMKRLIPKK